MPGKSRRSRGKHAFQRKKGKGRPSPQVIATQSQAVAQTYESVSPPKESVPPVRMPSLATAVVRYPYVLAELRRIGILAGVILAILIVLALVWR